MSTTTANQSNPAEPKSTAKRDALIQTEKEMQSYWDSLRLFEVDVPEDRTKPKFFVTCPYAYMNGRLHLGHCFTYSKGEFSASFQRMKGKVCLFPVGYHCTGMPIKACADKLAKEVAMFGIQFEKYSDELDALATVTLSDKNPPDSEDATNEDGSKKVIKKHSKAAAKAGSSTSYQWQIMESIGVPREDIHLFADPQYWLTYFPPYVKMDLSKLGFKVDWRRSFITTQANPYYDAFIRWQFNKLRALQKVKFGERYTIWSPVDQQPCMDHDRQTGEGVGPQEYVGLKLKWIPEASKSPAFASMVASNPALKGKPIFLMAATLRPETMYGQTNCFVGSHLTYGLYESCSEEIYIITEHAARNMAFQGLLKEKGKWHSFAKVSGKDLIGCAVHAPLSSYPHVYVLPLEHVVPNKGTGIVTSVPSDSPDDYAMLQDLKKKPEYYGIDPTWVQPYEVVPVLTTPTFGHVSAEAACAKFKVVSPKDRVLLDKAKEAVYKESFYAGTMLVPEYEGMSVEAAKPLIKKKLIDQHDAVIYSEPEREIISRSSDICVVSLCDQWYLDYGEPEWKRQTEDALSQLETFHTETKNQFESTLNWLNQWACARSFGLGTLLPWDPNFIIESLSDSTIYMAYYTVCHFLHSDVYGQVKGSLNISAQEMTDEVWEYIFNENAPMPATLPSTSLKTLRDSFTYFYPMDLRSSGKDLITNHLTFCLYNHSCLFDKKWWPKAIRANGHLLLNSAKMSKSSGNFMTVADALNKFGADATRMTMADAGDSVEDANFVEANANAAILRLHTQRVWFEEMYQKKTFREGPMNVIDTIFLHQMHHLVRQTEQAYESMQFREALMFGFFEFQDARDFYREVVGEKESGMHRTLLETFMRFQVLLLSPITPHWCEYIWQKVLGNTSSVLNALWPETIEPNPMYIDMATYLVTVGHTLRTGGLHTGRAPVEGTKRVCKVFVAKKLPEWQSQLVDHLSITYPQLGEAAFAFEKLKDTFATLFKTQKKAMAFVNALKTKAGVQGSRALQSTLGFDELELLAHAKPWLLRSLQLDELVLCDASDVSGLPKDQASKAAQALPGAPGFYFMF